MMINQKNTSQFGVFLIDIKVFYEPVPVAVTVGFGETSETGAEGTEVVSTDAVELVVGVSTVETVGVETSTEDGVIGSTGVEGEASKTVGAGAEFEVETSEEGVEVFPLPVTVAPVTGSVTGEAEVSVTVPLDVAGDSETEVLAGTSCVTDTVVSPETVCGTEVVRVGSVTVFVGAGAAFEIGAE